jgi:hypothetical protein
VADRGENGVGGITLSTFEMASTEVTVGLHVAIDATERLTGCASPVILRSMSRTAIWRVSAASVDPWNH